MSQYRDSMGNTEEDMKSRLQDGMDSAKSAASDTRDYVSGKYQEAKGRMGHMGARYERQIRSSSGYRLR